MAHASVAVTLPNYHYMAAASGHAILPVRYDRFAYGERTRIEREIAAARKVLGREEITPSDIARLRAQRGGAVPTTLDG